ncbi:alanine/ornithine racemase family PLP-dependent enzyme [Proteinivorax hydrogeniformans]|uniref:Alanine/ornithine racemase family PLP-dependent enzyme n=1 Tax=Proteinivorax hydrogeniformans TaxID=1826727 RepID=A0AAU8HU66_9FIRM
MYPQIEIDLNKISDNAKVMLEKCKEHGIYPCAVTKVTCADEQTAAALIKSGFNQLADSRVENIIKLKEAFGDKIETLLLRLPMLSDCHRVVKYCDISLNSELSTIKELNKHAKEQGKTHKIIIMVDLGDLREGIWPSDVLELKEQVKKLKNIEVLGLGTNLTCYGGVIPTNKNLKKLIELKESWEQDGQQSLKIISGGNSSSINIMTSKEIPEGVNHLRLGESLFLGRETVARNHIENTHLDVFKVKAEIIEVKKKPSVPIGTIGQDAFGETPTFEDKGEHLRAIAAIGRQDIALSMEPTSKNIKIIGGSSDHLLLEAENVDIKVGDIVEFVPEYGALLAAMTSPYVRKIYK